MAKELLWLIQLILYALILKESHRSISQGPYLPSDLVYFTNGFEAEQMIAWNQTSAYGTSSSISPGSSWSRGLTVTKLEFRNDWFGYP